MKRLSVWLVGSLVISGMVCVTREVHSAAIYNNGASGRTDCDELMELIILADDFRADPPSFLTATQVDV